MSAIKKDVTIGDCRLILGDCLEVMPLLGKVDAVVTDPPYGTTGCKWDAVIPVDSMWRNLNRLINNNGAVVFTASQPFTSVMVISNISRFKHEWIWQKNRGSNFASLKYQPMKEHESVLVFCEGSVNYYPIMEGRKGGGEERSKYGYKPSNTGKREAMGGMVMSHADHNGGNATRYPSSVQKINCEVGHHPTQKPVALMKYLVGTYTEIGDTVLDFTMGSGTTLVACAKLGRKGIGIELDEDYFEIACKRVQAAYDQPDLFVEQPKPQPKQEGFDLGKT